MKIQVDLLPPLMPNFVSAKSEPRKRQDGFSQPLIYDITDFTKEESVIFSLLDAVCNIAFIIFVVVSYNVIDYLLTDEKKYQQ